MKFRPRMLFTIAVLVFGGYAVFSSQDWPLGTKLFPWLIGIPVFILALVELGLEIRQAKTSERAREDTGDLQVDLSMGSSMVSAKAAAFFGWLLGFFIIIWLLGFFISVPLFAFLYLKVAARERWPMTVGLTLATFIFFVVLFDQILHLPWPTPVFERPEEYVRNILPEIDYWN